MCIAHPECYLGCPCLRTEKGQRERATGIREDGPAVDPDKRLGYIMSKWHETFSMLTPHEKCSAHGLKLATYEEPHIEVDLDATQRMTDAEEWELRRRLAHVTAELEGADTIRGKV